MDEFGFICIKLFGLVRLKMRVLFYLRFIVQLGPKVQSSVQAEHYIHCVTHHPPTNQQKLF